MSFHDSITLGASSAESVVSTTALVDERESRLENERYADKER